MNKFITTKKLALTFLFTFAANFTAQAEITEQSNNSFTVKHSFISSKSISTAIHQFGHVGLWWTAEFTLSGKGHNMFFNGIGLYENMPNGETITHLTKIEKGDNQWVWLGALGKLRGKNVNGKMKVCINKDHHGSKVSMEYTVKGEDLADNQAWANHIDTMLKAQMESLNRSLKKR